MIHNNKVYANSDEKFVKTLLIYADENTKLYYDAEFENSVKSAELKDLFLAGVTICDGDILHTPCSLARGEVLMTAEDNYTCVDVTPEE